MSELYRKFKQKARKLQQKHLKNCEIDKISIDSVRGFCSYRFVNKLLKDKSFATLRDDKHNVALFSINGTGVKIKIIAKDGKIFFECFAMSQYYTTDNKKNRAELEKWLLKYEITSVDIAFDSKKMIQLQKARITKKLHNTIYCNTENPKVKICAYDKAFKSKVLEKTPYVTFKSAPLFRAEFTLQFSPKHLNKNKKLKRPHSKSTRIRGASTRLHSLIENYNNINIKENSKNKTSIPKKKISLSKKMCLILLHNKLTPCKKAKNNKKQKKLHMLLTKLKN